MPVHFTEFLHTGNHRGVHTAKLGAPLVEGGLAKFAVAAKFFDGHACLRLLEGAEDLVIAKPCGLYFRNSPKFADLLSLPWYC